MGSVRLIVVFVFKLSEMKSPKEKSAWKFHNINKALSVRACISSFAHAHYI